MGLAAKVLVKMCLQDYSRRFWVSGSKERVLNFLLPNPSQWWGSQWEIWTLPRVTNFGPDHCPPHTVDTWSGVVACKDRRQRKTEPNPNLSLVICTNLRAAELGRGGMRAETHFLNWLGIQQKQGMTPQFSKPLTPIPKTVVVVVQSLSHVDSLQPHGLQHGPPDPHHLSEFTQVPVH